MEENFLTQQISNILESNCGMSRPGWDDYFMATALLISSRSNCGRLHVGCILVSQGEYKNRVIAAGYNGFIAGAPHNSKIRDGHEQATIHAEQNAIADAARRGISIAKSIAYISHFPCIHCSKLMAASGISEIKYHFDYNNDPIVLDLLSEWGTKITKL